LSNSQNNIKQSQAIINNEESLSLKNNVETKLAIDAEKEFFKSFLQPQQSFISPKLSAPEFTLQNDNKEDIYVEQETTKIFFEESITIGTAFDTYIIIQNQDNLYFVDQHAAHEMMLFDKFMLNFDKNKNIKQALLIPYIFNAKPDEREFILKNITEIQDCGFMIEEFGSSSFKISEVPLMFANADLEQFTNSFLENLSTEKIDIKFIKEKIAKAACKAAVKAGNKLLPDDIEQLKKNLDKSDTLRCPHGRPVIVKITKREIEKWFKRVF
jgi:DNA mismatch repair protein MutL